MSLEHTEGQEEKAQTALLGGPWWKHACETENWTFSSRGYDEMHCRNK